MTRTRFAAGLVALATAGAVTWTSLGVVVPARGQASIEVHSRARGTDRAPSLEAPMFLLLLGSDAREGSPREGEVDAIHLVGIQPSTGRAGILGVPEDAWVRIPGHGFDTLKRAAIIGGSELVVRTLESASGCRFDHAILTGFEGFMKLVDEAGGIPFDVPRRLRERGGSWIDLHAGEQVLDGAQALAWTRLRKGQTRPQGKISRSGAQNRLLVAALGGAREGFDRAPGTLLKMLAAVRRNVSHDLDLTQMFRLGQALLSIHPRDVRTGVVHTVAGTAEGRRVVRISRRGESRFVDLCGDGALGP